MTFKLNSRILLVSVAVLLASCGSKEVKIVSPGTYTTAQWESKLEIKDIAKNKIDDLSVDILAERNGPMRMEASAVLGIPVASYVMDRQGFRCAVYQSKTFYQGALTEQALKPILHFELSPVVLSRIVFDEPLKGSDWKCEIGNDGFVSACNSDSRKLRVSWDRYETTRTIHVDSPGYQMTWKIGAPKTDVQFRPQALHLEPSGSFKVIQL